MTHFWLFSSKKLIQITYFRYFPPRDVLWPAGRTPDTQAVPPSSPGSRQVLERLGAALYSCWDCSLGSVKHRKLIQNAKCHSAPFMRTPKPASPTPGSRAVPPGASGSRGPLGRVRAALRLRFRCPKRSGPVKETDPRAHTCINCTTNN